MTGRAEIEWADVATSGTTARATAVLRLADGREHRASFVVHAVPGDDRPPAPPPHRAALLAMLPVALREGVDVHVRGAVDDVTLANLAEWQHILARWVPDRFQAVAITADSTIVEGAPPRFDGGVTAFSGGLDSAFALLRKGPDGETRANRLSAGMMVHGFDVPLDEPEVFASARARSEAMVAATGAHLRVVETDIMHLLDDADLRFDQEVHGIWVAAALACVEADYDHTVIPSSYPYQRPRIPWGSTPTGDNLLGSRHRPVRHDGAGFDKFDKVRGVAGETVVLKNLRVCWAGQEKDRNCGHCWKCSVTQVALWLNGASDPPCFHDPCTLDELREVSVDGYRGALVQHYVDVARAQGRGDLVEVLEDALRHRRSEAIEAAPAAAGSDGAAYAWLQLFARLVREQNLDAARDLFDPKVRSFGTRVVESRDRETLVAEQWAPIWSTTRGFSIDPASVHIESGGDLWVLTARWSSLGALDGLDIARHGRCTFVLRQEVGLIRAVHSHFSLDPV